MSIYLPTSEDSKLYRRDLIVMINTSCNDNKIFKIKYTYKLKSDN